MAELCWISRSKSLLARKTPLLSRTKWKLFRENTVSQRQLRPREGNKISCAEGPSVSGKPSLSRKLRILLYVPNMVDYFRMILLLPTFVLAIHQKAVATSTLYILGLLLDGVDGYLARALQQVSSLGAFLDVVVDNLARSLMWSSALGGPLGGLIPCVEWAVFVTLHAKGGAAWKQGCFTNAPSWVTTAMANNFKNFVGTFVIAGLHLLPLWVWLHKTAPSSPLASWTVGVPLVLGRLYCLAIELWVLLRYADDLLEADAAAHNDDKAMD